MAHQSTPPRRPAIRPNLSNGSPVPVPREEWMKWPSVRAYIPRLPEGTTTWDIYRNLNRYGKIDFIRINESRQGNFTNGASVTFKYVWPRAVIISSANMSVSGHRHVEPPGIKRTRAALSSLSKRKKLIPIPKLSKKSSRSILSLS